MPSTSIRMNYRDAAEFLGVSVSTLRRLVEAEMVPVIRYSPNVNRFDRADLQKFIDRRKSRLWDHGA